MSEQAEFRPIESTPARKVWPYAVLGAVIVGLVVYIARMNVRTAEQRPVVAANLPPKPVPAPAKEGARPAVPGPRGVDRAKGGEGPKVVGGVANTATRLAMVAKSELD